MIDHKRLFEELRTTLFQGAITAGQVTGLEALLATAPSTMATTHLAYCFATVYHETAATMLPVEEYGHGRGRTYGVAAGPWHEVYDGRGDVQLTWQANYRKATARLHTLGVLAADLDLEKNPKLALDPKIAGAILYSGMAEGWFTGKKLGDYFHDKVCDPIGARRIINGEDRAALIAGYFVHIAHALAVATIATPNARVVQTTMAVSPNPIGGTPIGLAPPATPMAAPAPTTPVAKATLSAPITLVPKTAPPATGQSWFHKLFGGPSGTQA